MYCKKTYSFKPYLFILLINFAHDGMLNTLLTEQKHLCIGDDTKAPLAAARTALGKQTIRSVQWRYLSHYRNSVEKKLLTRTKFLWRLRPCNPASLSNRSYGPWSKTIYGGRPSSWFLKIFILVLWLSRSSNSALVDQISSKSDDVL